MLHLIRRGFAMVTSLALVLSLFPTTSMGVFTSLQVQQVYAAPCTLVGANVQPASLVAGTTNQVTFSYTSCDDTDANSNINITFPAGFNVAAATGGTCTMSGTYGTSVVGQIVTIARSGGTDDPAGEAESCTINNITNPVTTGSTGTYSAQITGGGDPQRDFSITADIIVADGTSPTVTISSASSNPTNTSPIPVTVTFNEDVTGFVVGDLTLGNGSASNFAGGPAVYTFDLTPSGQGAVTVDIAAGVAQDTSSNPNTVATQFTRSFDSVQPTVTMTSAASDPTNTSPISVTATFSETVTGFAIGDIVAGNATVGNFNPVSGTVYTFDLTPSGQGTVTADITGAVAVDAANNGNTAATQFSRTFDSVQPTVTISSAASNPTNTSPISVTVTFSENVTGFVVGDLTLGNGSASNFAGGPSVYTFDLTPSGQGLVTVDVAGAVAQDSSANNNSAAVQFSRTFDSVQPTVTISSASSNPTNTSPIPITVTFSEDVTGFVVGDLTIGNGSASNFAGGPSVYTFDLTPAGQGLVTVDVAGTVAVDAANNGNTAATQFSRTFDSVQPTVTISSTATDPTNAPIPVTVTFSESVTGFVIGDLTLGNGNASNFAGAGTTYTFDLTPAGQGLVTVDIAGGVAQDSSTNNNSAAVQFSRTFDSVQPTVAISSAAPNPTNTSPIPVTVTFNESVTGFDSSDLVLGNGSASNFAGAGTTYTFDLTPGADGLVTVDINASIAIDSANNGNTAATQFTRTFDTLQPNVSMSSVVVDPTNTTPIPVTVTFSESVTGFVIGDITPGNATVSNFAGAGTTYTFDLTPSGQGLVTADIAGGVAQDAAGNTNTAAAQFSRTFDSTQPTVTITSAAANPTNTSPITVTVTFSEDVTGFVVGDLTLSNGAASNFAGGPSIYTFDLTPAGQGTVTVDVAGGVAQDSSANTNTAAVQFSRTFDSVSPTVTIDQAGAQADPANASPVNFTVVFSEDVTGFDNADVNLSGTAGATTAVVTGGPATYNVAVSGMTADGTVIATVNAGGTSDAALNTNAASTSTDNSVNFDGGQPSVIISSGTTSPTNTSPIPVTVTFSENVTGFVVGDISVGNGSAGNFNAVSGTVYTFDLTPTPNSVVTVDIAAGVAEDGSSNTNTAATQFTITHDTVEPSVAITSGVANPTNVSAFTVTVTFSEAVTGFTTGDLSVTNGSVSGFAGGPAVYTFNLTPAADGVITVDVAGTVAIDAANNANTAAPQFSTTFDGTQPSVSISSAASNPINAAIPVTVTFNEDVTGFVVGDLTIGNGSASNFAGGPAVYTFDLTAGGQGLVTVDIAAGIAQDSATNDNTAATQFTRTFDSLQPTVTLSSTATDPTNALVPMTVTFNENVAGFDLSDINVGNGAAGNLAGGPAVYTFDLTPSADGAVTVDIAAGVTQDAAANTNTAATQFSITYDATAPSVSITSGISDPTNSSPFSITITFSENVTGFVIGDITVGNGAAGNLAGGPSVYTADISPAAPGLVTIDVAGAVAQDTAGNDNTSATSLTRTFDSDQPSVILSATTADPTNSTNIPVTVTFSEDVTGFDAADLTLSNGTLNNFSGGPSIYTFDLTPSADGAVTAQALAGVATDAALNNNLASNLLSITFDSTQPTVTIDQDGAQADPTNISPINFTVVFSENVIGFDDADITLNGTAGATTSVVSGGPATYNVAVSGMTSAGTVIADINAGVATDAANNGNTSSTSTDNSVSFDATSPSILNIASTTADGSYGPGSIITITVTFTEIVTVTGTPQLTLETGATDAVVNLTGGSGTDTLSFDYTVGANESASDLDYLDTLALALNGGTIQDSLGNNGTLTLPAPGNPGSLSSNASFVIDAVEPMLTIWSMDLNTKTITLTFDETVDASTIDPTGITIQDAATATTSFTLTGGTTASPNGTTIVITLLDADIPNFSGFTTFFLTITSAVVDDLLGNSVVAIVDGSGLQAGSVNKASSGGRRRTTEEATTTTSSSSGGSSSSSSTSGGSVLGATTSRDLAQGSGSGGDAGEEFTEEIMVLPFKTTNERRDVLGKLRSTFGERFALRGTIYGATPGRNGTNTVGLINSPLNVIASGTKVPRFSALRSSNQVTITYTEEVLFLRPITVQVKNIGTSNWKDLRVKDKYGKELSSFFLTEDQTIYIRTNYVRDLIIDITTPIVVNILSDAASDPESKAILRLMELGVVQGHPDGTFKPNDGLKRSETSKMVGLLLGFKADKILSNDEWYSALLRALIKSAIIKGHIPAETLELRANFLALVAKSKGINITKLPSCTEQTFEDVLTDTWYCGLVLYAQQQNWIRETSGAFNPSGIVTRSWAAGVLDRAF